ncbi:MAG: insulinase family protein [Bacteroidaceae bacterium]|nr:insulinase family protein [Bacteroidaceae bacterium]
MKKYLVSALAAVMLLALGSCSKKYETVAGDPLKTKIYTLDNGLKVYMTVNKDEPRIQTYIAVRSGGKNDPSDNTGLAHYLEHIMFKGSESFGTSDYEAEKPLLDQIEALFDVYKKTTDPVERKAIYRQIDSISYQASLIAIPNEYDKLMAQIGSQGTNAYTSNDVTCYQENIPSNQIENWAKVQADRFKNLVIRGFHTELEAVYEEYNMYLNDDGENAMIAIDSVLFKNHPYGLQAIIGTSEHLKSPQISAIKKQKATYYVPNNVAICVSGDFDPDQFVEIIEKYFGDWEPNPALPEFTYKDEAPITRPVEKNVYGTESEFVMISWRLPGEKDPASDIIPIAMSVLYNGQAGLFDQDVNQKQVLLDAGASNYGRTDYCEAILQGYPKEGQTLTEVRDILLAEIAKLRAGDFDEDLVKAAIANYKLRQMRSIESNSQRANRFVDAFVNGRSWADQVGMLDRISKITKQDIVDWANTYLGENSYALVYKRQGKNPKNEKIEAPEITPIATNRDKQSQFLTEIMESQVKPIEPVFVDYSKDLSTFKSKSDVEVVYKKNETNDVANLVFRFNRGIMDDPALGMAFDYLSYLGTSDMSASELAFEEYKLACNHGFSASTNISSYTITGLAENISKDLQLVEKLIMNAVPDEDVLANLKADEMTSRLMAKQSQRSCSSALSSYLMYGPEYVKATTMTNEQVMSITSEELLSKVREMMNLAHEVMYYGPASESEVKDMLAQNHNIAETLAPLTRKYPKMVQVTEPAVYIAPYDQRQFNYTQYSNRGEHFSLEDAPSIELFNEYFGGGMNTIVFQEMREARALAYSAGAMLSEPSTLEGTYCFYARIGSQNDKLKDAVEAFDLIINDMPESEKSFQIAKAGLESVLRTTRVNGRAVLNSYFSARELGLTEPIDKYIYEHLADLTMDDLVACQQKWVKGRTYIYGLLGDASGMDMDFLRTLGPVRQISLDEIFGF